MFFKLENESVFIICAKLSEVTLFIEKKARTEIENSGKN